MERQKIEVAWSGHSDCRRCGIRELVLFADLREEDFVHIHMPISDLHYEKGSLIYPQGGESAAVFTIRGGVVKLVQYLPNGRHRIVRLLRQGDVAGLEALFGQPYEQTAIALQSVLTCRIPCEVVHRLNRETPRLLNPLMERWRRALHRADEWLTTLSTGSARARVARLFLHLLDEGAHPTCHLFSREDVGAILGLTTETSSRVIAELKRGEALTELKTNLFRCDRERLEEISLD